jgi:hypothetical protein
MNLRQLPKRFRGGRVLFSVRLGLRYGLVGLIRVEIMQMLQVADRHLSARHQ